MDYKEAIEWLNGNRSMCNIIHDESRVEYPLGLGEI